MIQNQSAAKTDGVAPPLTSTVSEDWMAVGIGLFLFFLSLLSLTGADVFGWVVKTNVWISTGKAMAPVSAKFSSLGGFVSLILTYLFLTTILNCGARFLGARVGKFVTAFTVIFFVSYLCWAAGHFAYVAATPDQLKKFGISWSLKLTGEAGFIIALVAGLIVGNLLPGVAAFLREAIRPEWYIKTAIVLLGASLGVKSAEALGLAKSVMFRGLCAIVEAYLIYWALVYFIARKYFRFNREWAA